MVLNTNLYSMNSNEALSISSKNIYLSMEKLSTGLRINKAADDPSGLAIADKLRTQASSVKQSIDNASQAISLLQIADRAMSEQSNILDTIKQKILQGASDTTSQKGREIISTEIGFLLDQFDEIAKQTRFEDKFLLQKNGSSTDKTEQIEFVLGESSQNIVEARIGIQSNTKGLASTGDKTLDTLKSESKQNGGILSEDFSKYLKVIDDAITDLNIFRSDYGSVQNQVESTMRNLLTQRTNITNAESVIRDVDYAKEAASLKQALITYDAGSFALTQANLIKDATLNVLV